MSFVALHSTYKWPIGDGPYTIRLEVGLEDCRIKDMTTAAAVEWKLYVDASAPVLTKTLGAGISIVDGAPEVVVSKADLSALAPGLYRDHARATDDSAVSRTISMGFVELIPTPTPEA